MNRTFREKTANGIALLHSGSFFVEQMLKHPLISDEIKAIDLYDLPEVDLNQYAGLIVPKLIDQEFLYKERERIRAFLDSGKVLVFSGHLFRSWLPGGSFFIPKEVSSFRDYMVKIVHSHPIFEGVLPEDLTFKKGVAGFFARGHHPLPPGAEVLLTFTGGEPIVYIDRQSTRGTLLVHSGNDLIGYAGSGNTAGRLAPQLLRWIREEYQILQEKRRFA